jgi:hypothetical protein
VAQGSPSQEATPPGTWRFAVGPDGELETAQFFAVAR